MPWVNKICKDRVFHGNQGVPGWLGYATITRTFRVDQDRIIKVCQGDHDNARVTKLYQGDQGNHITPGYPKLMLWSNTAFRVTHENWTRTWDRSSRQEAERRVLPESNHLQDPAGWKSDFQATREEIIIQRAKKNESERTRQQRR